MYARVNTTEWNPEKVDAGMELTEEKIIPSYQEHPGFRGYILLTEPDGGPHASRSRCGTARRPGSRALGSLGRWWGS